MKIHELLFEEEGKSVAWAFARMNPITAGHQMLVEKVKKEARGGDYYIFLSHSQDKKKNPLDWATKVKFFKKIMPQHANHLNLDDSLKTLFLAADWLYEQGYRKWTFVCGSDRVPVMTDNLNGWNSEPIRQKYNRQMVDIKVVSAGERDPDAEGLAGISGSKAREDVVNDDLEKFQEHTGLEGDLAKELFDAVKAGMGPIKNPVKEDSSLEQMDLSNHPHGTIVMLKMNPKSAQQLKEWCEQYKVPCLDTDHLHLTVLSSTNPVPHLKSLDGNTVKVPAMIKGWGKLGESALVLHLASPMAHQFHSHLRKQGGSHNFSEFLPHASVNYDCKSNDLPGPCPSFPLLFDTISVKPLDPNFSLPASS